MLRMLLFVVMFLAAYLPGMQSFLTCEPDIQCIDIGILCVLRLLHSLFILSICMIYMIIIDARFTTQGCCWPLQAVHAQCSKLLLLKAVCFMILLGITSHVNQQHDQYCMLCCICVQLGCFLLVHSVSALQQVCQLAHLCSIVLQRHPCCLVLLEVVDIGDHTPVTAASMSCCCCLIGTKVFFCTVDLPLLAKPISYTCLFAQQTVREQLACKVV